MWGKKNFKMGYEGVLISEFMEVWLHIISHMLSKQKTTNWILERASQPFNTQNPILQK